MVSTFLGIEMGKKSLISHQTAIQTTGHNISNTNNEGYSRQVVTLQTEPPLYVPGLTRAQQAGQIGQGVSVEKIDRIRSDFIDDRIIQEKDSLGYWKTTNDYLYQIELIHNEPNLSNIRTLLDEFWQGWQELANNPEERATREVVKHRGITLTERIKHTYRQLFEVQKNADTSIEMKIANANEIIKSIRDLNVQIKKSENLGDRPNDLKDKRDLLVGKLSELMNISVSRTDKDEFIVYLDGSHLIQGDHYELLETRPNPQNYGFKEIYWEKTDIKANISNGEIKGLLDIRDKVLKYHINQLDNFTTNLVDLINEVHKDGFGLDGKTNRNFFNFIPVTALPNGDFDRNNDGTPEVTAIFKVAGINTLNPKAEIGIAGTMTLNETAINYVATDTVEDIIKKINDAQIEVVAYLNHNNQLSLKATIVQDDRTNENFAIRHIADSGNFLSTYAGILKPGSVFDWNVTGQAAQLQGNYTVTPFYHAASWVELDESIKLDVDNIAAAKGIDVAGTGDFDTPNGIGDGTNALEIANLRYKKAMIGENETFNDFYTAVIGKLGTEAEQADNEIKTREKLIENLKNLWQSYSGVNLDEEFANLVMYQHGYNAAARFVSIIDRMLETITRMGV